MSCIELILFKYIIRKIINIKNISGSRLKTVKFSIYFVLEQICTRGVKR